MVQLSHPYMTTGKRAFVGKVMSLFFNTLSRLVIAFLPRSKHLLISCLQSPSTVILKPKKIKPVIASTFSPFICHEVRQINLSPVFPQHTVLFSLHLLCCFQCLYILLSSQWVCPASMYWPVNIKLWNPWFLGLCLQISYDEQHTPSFGLILLSTGQLKGAIFWVTGFPYLAFACKVFW